MAEHAVQVTINAKDEATKQIKAIDKQLAALTKQKATVSLDLSTDAAQKQLADITANIDKLKGEKAQVVVEAKVTQALSALDDIAGEAKRVQAAVEALSVALGPELAAGADLDSIISDFMRMGLSLDEITAHADRLGGKLREVGQGSVSGRITTGFSRIGAEARSASASASTLSTAIGNSVQDLGQVAGLSGAAGQAIGQMGDSMATAALKSGSLRSALSEFAAVAGPVAALAAAVAIVNAVVDAHRKSAEEAAAATKQLGDAMDDASDPALGLADNMEPIVDRLHEFDRMDQGFWTDLTNGIEGFASSLPGVGAGLSLIGVDVNDMVETVSDVMPALIKAGVDAFDLAKFIAGTGEAAGTKISKAYQAGIINAEEYVAALKAITSERSKAANVKATDDAFFNVSLGQLRALQDAADKAANPLKFFGDQWAILINDMADGSIDTQAAADAVNYLNQQLGLTPDQIRKIASDELVRKAEEISKAFEKSGKDLEDWADRTAKAFEDVNQAFIDLGSAQGAFDEMSNVFNQMARDAEGLGLAFDLKNAPLDALGEVKDFQEGLRDLVEFIDDPKGLKGKIPNILNPNDVNAGPMLQKIAGMRDDVQKAITDAFATGGATKAQATADAYVKQFVDSLHGKIKASDIETLWGLDDLQATLKVGVDQASMAEAQAMLEILTSLTGETPWTAQLKFDLISGAIDANTAKELIARNVKAFGIDVNTNLLAPDAKSKSAAKAAADRWAAEAPNKISMGTVVAEPGVAALVAARNEGQLDADKVTPIVFQSTVAAPTVRRFDQGGTVDGAGGIAGERGPEILNRRYLTEGPTYVPPGTRVTSRRRTALILRTRGAGGLRRYDSGGTVPSGSTIVNFNGVGAVGNRYDLMRTIHRAELDKIRLRGTRG